MKKIIKIYKKYKSIINYLFFGGCTTLVNIITYYIFSHVLNISVMSSTIVAWIVAVLFAYITNRKWVFNSNAHGLKEISNEIFDFFACRVATGVVDWALMFILVKRLGFNDIIIKIIANIIVIILNYIASKLIIFNSDKKYDKKQLLIFASFAFLSFVFLLKTPTSIWVNGAPYTDSSVFKTVALMMRNGFVPYLDTFDHKGPLIYIINYLADFISMSKGLWLVELINLTVTLVFFFKTAKLKCNNIASYIITLLALTFLLSYFEGGNYTEEYALPFIAVSTYIFLDYLLNNKINNSRLMVCGLSFGSVLLLRPNMVGLWFVFCLYIFVNCIIKKQSKELLHFILFFVLGMSIIMLPILLWLYFNGAFGNFIDAYIKFNSAYSLDSTNGFKLGSIWQLVFTFVNSKIVLMSLISAVYIIKYNKLNIVYFIYAIVSIYLICMSGYQFGHYMIIFAPIIIYPMASIASSINKRNNDYNIVEFLCACYLLYEIILPSWLPIIKDIPNIYYSKENNNVPTHLITMSEVIVNNTSEKDKISVYGNLDYLYLSTNRIHATRYSFNKPLFNHLEKIRDEYFEELKEEMPKIIVIHENYGDEDIKSFCDQNNYRVIWEYDSNNDNTYKIYKID